MTSGSERPGPAASRPAGSRPTLTVAMITKDEERNLARSLPAIRFADEIVIVDSGSTDGTRAAAEAVGARFVVRPFNGFSEAKNAAIELATSDYVLVVDADEVVSVDLASEVRAAIGRGDRSAWRVARKSMFLGRFLEHSGWFPDYGVRLFRRGAARFRPARVHESLAVDGPVGTLPQSAFLWHHTYPDLDDYLSRFNRYTSLAALDLDEHRAVRFPFLSLLVAPPFHFLKQYVLKRGFLDGAEGFVLAVLSALYPFVKYAKLWDRRRRRPGPRAQ